MDKFAEAGADKIIRYTLCLAFAEYYYPTAAKLIILFQAID